MRKVQLIRVPTFRPTTFRPQLFVHNFSSNRVRVRVPLTRLLFFEIEPKVVGQKNRSGRSVVGRKVVGRKGHPPQLLRLKKKHHQTTLFSNSNFYF